MSKPKPVYTARLPQVRVTREQLVRIPSDAIRAGYVKPDGSPDLSRYIRSRLFGEEDQPEEVPDIWA